MCRSESSAERADSCVVVMASDNTAGVYSIGAVAKMLGISAQTLRAWEERYRLIVPSRSEGGQRIYSRDDVEQLRFVQEQIDTGLQSADAHRLLAERTRDRAATLGKEPGQAHGSADSRISILLAERDPFAADFADFFLRTEGYRVRVVLDVMHTRQMLDDDPPDVLIVDLMISGGAGLALCSGVRDRSSLPVLAVSPLDSRDQALAAGVDAFLQKPLDPLQFVSTVRDLLGTSAYLRRRATAPESIR